MINRRARGFYPAASTHFHDMPVSCANPQAAVSERDFRCLSERSEIIDRIATLLRRFDPLRSNRHSQTERMRRRSQSVRRAAAKADVQSSAHIITRVLERVTFHNPENTASAGCTAPVSSPPQRLVLRFEPCQGFVKMLGSEIGPVLINDMEVRINRLDREKAAEASPSAPANNEIQSRDVL